MEILATREIIKGDEIFIDSGKNWEQAWDQHLRNWQPQRMGKGEWKSANVLNNELGPLEAAPDLSENHISTDSCGVLFTGCLYERESYNDWDGCADADIEWEIGPSMMSSLSLALQLRMTMALKKQSHTSMDRFGHVPF